MLAEEGPAMASPGGFTMNFFGILDGILLRSKGDELLTIVMVVSSSENGGSPSSLDGFGRENPTRMNDD